MVSYLGTMGGVPLLASSPGVSTHRESSLPRALKTSQTHRLNLPNRTAQQRKAGKSDDALRMCALRGSKIGQAPFTKLRRPEGGACASSVLGAVSVSVGRRGAQGPLGRWRGWVWALGYLVAGWAGWPSPLASTVGSARYLHRRPSGRHGGSQVSVRKVGVGRVLSNITDSVSSCAMRFWRPVQKCSSPVLSTPVIGAFDNSGEGCEESSAGPRGIQPGPLVALRSAV